jgi:hypothetical protein
MVAAIKTAAAVPARMRRLKSQTFLIANLLLWLLIALPSKTRKRLKLFLRGAP